MLARNAAPANNLLAAVTPGNRFDCDPPGFLEFPNQAIEQQRIKAVAGRMREDRDPACCADPSHRIAKSRPLMRYIARLSATQIVLEDFAGSAVSMAGCNPAREVGTRDLGWILDLSQSPVESARKSCCCQFPVNLPGSIKPPRPQPIECLGKLEVRWIETQAQHMDASRRPSDRDLHATHPGHPDGERSVARCGKTADRVVIGQRKKPDTSGLGLFRQSFRREGSVRVIRMAMQIRGKLPGIKPAKLGNRFETRRSTLRQPHASTKSQISLARASGWS